MRIKLPIEFSTRMEQLLGDEYKEYERCFEEKHRGGLRVNSLKLTPEQFEQISPYEVRRIPFIPNGFFYNESDQPARHPYYFGGLYYIQEPSAMTPASLLPVQPKDKVLDLCAAPGGKSTELAARLQGEGLLVANDISNSRAKALLKNIELFGVRNAVVVSEAPGKLVDSFRGYFDKILVDAPCSGEGMFRKSPAIMKNWEQYGVDYYNKLQKEILPFAVQMLKPGGYLLYSTCTFSPEENEGTISYLLEMYPEMEVVPAIPDSVSEELFQTLDSEDQERLTLMKERDTVSYEGFDFGRPDWANGQDYLKQCIRLWPHKLEGEGHFVTLLKKKGGNEESVPAYTVPAKERRLITQEAREFLDSLRLEIDESKITVREERLYLLPDGIVDLKGLRVLRSGLLLGEMKKNRFEPSQALASSLRMSDYDNIYNLSVDDEDVIRYLKCEAIEIKDSRCKDGWVLVCVDGYPLGWGKLNKSSFKNKYLPGWRWM